MKKLPLISRILLGLLYTAAAIGGLMGKIPPPEPEAAQAFMGQLFGSGLLPLVKIFELISGIALLSGFFVPAALFLLAPITFIIAWYHLALDPSGAIVGFVLTALWIGSAMGYKQIFAAFLTPKFKGE